MFEVISEHIIQTFDKIIDGHALFTHQLVHFFMGNAMLCFLTNKICHTLLQFQVCDLIAEQAHTLNKITLAIWKGQAQGIEHAGQKGIAAKPVARNFIQFKIKLGPDHGLY